MTLRLLIDMNLLPSWVEVLREAGFEAAHWYHIGAPNAPDSELFDWASRKRIYRFYPRPRFRRLAGRHPRRISQCFHDDVSPDALAPRAIDLLRRFAPQLSAGALVVVDEMRERVRILPLGSSQP